MSTIKLTPEQEAVVHNRGGNLLVAAAAGSGKTKVMVDRIMNQIQTEKRDISDFVVITFTKDAAKELRKKIKASLNKILAENPQNAHVQKQVALLEHAQISTVHSFCQNLLRSHSVQANISADFRVCDQNESKLFKAMSMDEVLEEAYLSIEKEPNIKAFIDELAFGRDDRAVAGILHGVYDTMETHAWPEDWCAMCMDSMSIDSIKDAYDTPWGQFIVNNIKSYVSYQIPYVQAAQRLIDRDGGLQAAYGDNILCDQDKMQHILDATNWNTLQSAVNIPWTRLGRVKKDTPVDSALQEEFKTLRDGYKKAIETKTKGVYADSQEVMADLTRTNASIVGMFQMVQAFKKRYTERKEANNVLDFNDLEHYTIRLLIDEETKAPTQCAVNLQSAYHAIMVDEYQDSNEIQEMIFEAISTGKNRFMVGDMKQAIYRFRGADPSVFLKHYNSYKDYTVAVDGEPRKIILNKNFRSREEILEATNAVMKTCMSETTGGVTYTEDEQLFFGQSGLLPLETPSVEVVAIEMDGVNASIQDAGEDVTKVEVEANYVAQRISAMIGNDMIQDQESGEMRPVKASDIAILMRSTKNTSSHYIKALNQRGIAAEATNTAGSILDTPEVANLFCLMQVLDNPHQDYPLVGIMASPLYGFTASELAQLPIKQEGIRSFYDAVCKEKTTSPKCKKLLDDIHALQKVSRRDTLSELLDEILCRTNAKGIFGCLENGEQRWQNIEAFENMVVKVEKSICRSLRSFICTVEEMRRNGIGLPPQSRCRSDESVQILSIHASKGLEYPIVFLSDMSRSFNSSDLKKPALFHPTLGVGVQAVDKAVGFRYPTIARNAIATCSVQESKSEELRILYVAMTRAKQRLIMTHCAKLTGVADKLRNIVATAITPASTQDMACPGEWILLTHFACLASGVAKPWEFTYIQGADIRATHMTQEDLHASNGALVPAVGSTEQESWDSDILEEIINFVYPHIEKTQTPSKAVPTQIAKRRQIPTFTPLRTTAERKAKGLTAAEIGSATHAFLQYADFRKCYNKKAIEHELKRMQDEKRMFPEEADAVNITALCNFFMTRLGKELQNIAPSNIHREFPFSVLYDPAEVKEGEKGPVFNFNPSCNYQDAVLLQGKIDMFIMDGKTIRLYDFKTGKQPADAEILGQYIRQVDIYAQVLTAMFQDRKVEIVTKELVFLQSGDTVAA